MGACHLPSVLLLELELALALLAAFSAAHLLSSCSRRIPKTCDLSLADSASAKVSSCSAGAAISAGARACHTAGGSAVSISHTAGDMVNGGRAQITNNSKPELEHNAHTHTATSIRARLCVCVCVGRERERRRMKHYMADFVYSPTHNQSSAR